jgi:hypothetical protein
MSNNTSSKHFDAVALLTHVAQQDVGLRVSTNDPANFRRILYETISAQPMLRCYIYADPSTSQAFYLLKKRLEEQTEVPND